MMKGWMKERVSDGDGASFACNALAQEEAQWISADENWNLFTGSESPQALTTPGQPLLWNPREELETDIPTKHMGKTAFNENWKSETEHNSNL